MSSMQKAIIELMNSYDVLEKGVESPATENCAANLKKQFEAAMEHALADSDCTTNHFGLILRTLVEVLESIDQSAFECDDDEVENEFFDDEDDDFDPLEESLE